MAAKLQSISSSQTSLGARYPTVDADGNSHLLGAATLAVKYYDLTGTRFANPDSSFTGFGADGTWYDAGVPELGHAPVVAAWSGEAFGANRGNKNRFPDRILVLGTEKEVAILDADSLELWMRFVPSTAVGGNFLGHKTAHYDQIAFDVDAGVLYVVAGGSVRVADFRLDRMASWSSTAATITEEPGGTTIGSILNRNVDEVLVLAGPGGATDMAGSPAWAIHDEAISVAVGSKRIGTPLSRTVAVGTRRSVHVRSTRLPSTWDAQTNPLRDHIHQGVADGVGTTGAMVVGSGGGDTVVDDDGDATGSLFSASTDFSGSSCHRGMAFRLNNGGYQPPVPILNRANGELELLHETLVGHPTEWEVLAWPKYLYTHSDGSLGILAGHRLIHAGLSWTTGSGASSTTLLNPSSTIPHADLPSQVGDVYCLSRHLNYYYVGTDVGLWRVEVLSAVSLGVPTLLYAGTPAATPEALYSLLEGPTEVRAFVVDPQSGLFGVGQGRLPFVDSLVAAPPNPLLYAFGVGQDLIFDGGLGNKTVTLVGSLTAAQIKQQLESEVPESVWTHLGAGRWRVESLCGTVLIGAGAANATLGFAGAETQTPTTGRLTQIDPSLQEVRAQLYALSPEVTSQTAAAGASIIVQQVLVPPPMPMGLELSEPGGQVITDDGAGGFAGDVDTAYEGQSVDYVTGDLLVKFATTPTGDVTIRQLSSGIVHSVAAYTNPLGPPTLTV